MKNIPFTKIFLHVDNGYADKSGTGLAVEYNISSKNIIWRKLDQKNLDSD